MSESTYGELCAGYGGLGMGVQSALGGRIAWVSEFDAHPSRILGHHWPDAPNLGDMTTIDWRAVEPVDVITGGTPCQDLSGAGRRAGMTEGTRSNLWVQMREAIHAIRPKLVVWENVRGAYSAHADSSLEHCTGCMGGAEHNGSPLRALGRVLGDLSDLGYDAWWYGLRAADVGGAHGRFRVFVFATPADADRSGWGELGRPVAVRPEQPATPPDLMLPSAVQMLPTPTSSDAKSSGSRGYGGNDFSTLTDATVRNPQDWGVYEAAIRRCENAWGRTAPAPTKTGPKGSPQLSPRFVEWLMGLPDGHVTNPAIWDGVKNPRNAQLKALGNGVVPQQAAAATSALLRDSRQENIA